jgi:hypothetical protein
MFLTDSRLYSATRKQEDSLLSQRLTFQYQINVNTLYFLRQQAMPHFYFIAKKMNRSIH